MRYLKLLPALLLILILPLSAASVLTDGLSSGFASEENLALFDFQSEENTDFYENVGISLLTQSPGEAVYTWFGHTSLEVEIPGYLDRDYNWGVFAFSDSFYRDFIFGRLYYSLIASSTEYSILRAEMEGRELTRLTLDLTPSAKKGIIDFLNYNTQPENQQYLYHYYLDNCATRVRDIYNAATDGGFRSWAEAVETGRSFRDYTTDYMSERSYLVSWTLNALQGPEIDRKINLYEAAFMPDVLLDAISEYEGGKAAEVLAAADSPVTRPKENDLLITSLIIGAVLAVILYTEEERHPRVWGLLTFIFTLFLSVLSIVLLFFMLFTNHDVTFGNENILFLNPLLLIPAVQGLRTVFTGRRKEHRASVRIYRLLSASALLLLVLKGLFPSVFIQENLAAVALVLPVYLAGSIRLRRKAGK